MCGETWCFDVIFSGAKNMPLFSTLFLGIPEMGRWLKWKSRFLRSTAHKGVSGFGRNDESVSQ